LTASTKLLDDSIDGVHLFVIPASFFSLYTAIYHVPRSAALFLDVRAAFDVIRAIRGAAWLLAFLSGGDQR
jgi:hypothetical protein